MITRPIIAAPGTILWGLGRWVDSQLQLLVKQLPYVCRGSADLAYELSRITARDSDRLFTADATSMYTNIDTDHALEQIGEFFQTNPIRRYAKADRYAIQRIHFR